MKLLIAWFSPTSESRIISFEREDGSGRRFAEHIPVATHSRPLLGNGFGKHITVATDTQITTDEPFKCVSCMRSAPDQKGHVEAGSILHRNPASRRRRRKGNCKRQIRLLARESAPHQQTRNSLTVIKIWS
jgi:hypothetical protein